MNILIIDDDVNFINIIKNDLLTYFSQYDDEVNFLINTQPTYLFQNDALIDFAFIDINLSQVNGIDIASDIKNKNYKTVIIFISSHHHLIHNTFIANPFYFIRKSMYNDDLKTLFFLLDKKMNSREMIMLNYKRNKTHIFYEDIIYIESQIHKLVIYTNKKNYYDNRSLKELAKLLPKQSFVKIHKSFIINIKFLTNYKSSTITLYDKFQLTIGRSYKESFEKFYMEYLVQ